MLFLPFNMSRPFPPHRSPKSLKKRLLKMFFSFVSPMSILIIFFFFFVMTLCVQYVFPTSDVSKCDFCREQQCLTSFLRGAFA